MKRKDLAQVNSGKLMQQIGTEYPPGWWGSEGVRRHGKQLDLSDSLGVAREEDNQVSKRPTLMASL